MATILVVDGEQKIRDQLHSMLSSQGHEVLLATNGVDGLELFRHRRPRFTLLGFHLPDMDGIDVLRQMRVTDRRAAVIMLDEGVQGALKIQAWRLGALDFMKKDLPLKVLSNALERAMRRSPPITDVSQESQGSRATAQVSSVTPGSAAILVVDDEPFVCTMLSQFITKLGYRALVANNGWEALALVEQVAPSLIIIDIAMPKMDGVSLARALREGQYTGSILGLTGGRKEDQLQAMLDVGALDVIGKPINMERLELAIHLGCLLAA